MKYFKRLTETSINKFKYLEIYNHDSLLDYYGDAYHVEVGLGHFKEVPEIEYLLQVAKEKYPIGTIFKNASETASTVKGDHHIDCNCIFVSAGEFTQRIIYDNNNKLWYEIISSPEPKTITDYENDTMMEKIIFNGQSNDTGESNCPSFSTKEASVNDINKPMTHQEAIKELRSLLFIGSRGIYSKQALKLSIKNMEQCEVYDKPVEMEVSDNQIEFKPKSILGIFKGFYVDTSYYHWDNARPIKPKVLDPQEWANKKDGLTFSELYYEYTQYLNDNK
jgi:hypothetical protein